MVVGAGAKAYVLRYTRNQIAILDTSQTADAGAPIGTIDLGAFVQPADADGTVEMSAGVYVASRINVGDQHRVATDHHDLVWEQTSPR